jgi:hypothetical protein
MVELSKTYMKDKAQHYILETLMEAQKRESEQRVVTGIPTTQWEQFDEILEKQIERVFRFLGR